MAADINTLYAVLGTIVTVLGSASAWRFYEKRAMHKERDEDFIRHDCKDRISKLEALLESAAKEKDDLRRMVLDLTRQVAELRVTVDFLRVENEKLEKNIVRPTKTARKTK
jgi:septal ring factor EnvC (AmiA/AmiB activator)